MVGGQTGGPLPSLRRSSAWQSALRTPAAYSSNCVRRNLRTTSVEYLHGCHRLLGACGATARGLWCHRRAVRCGASHGTRYVRYRGWYAHGASTTVPPRGELPCASLLRHRARVTRVDIARRGLVLAVVAVLRGDVLHRGQALHPLLRVAVLLARRRKRRRVGVVVHGFRPSASLWPTCLAPRARRRARAL